MSVRPAFRRLLACAIAALALYVVWSAWDYTEARRFDAALQALRARHVVTSLARGSNAIAAPDAMRFYAAAAQLASATRYPTADTAFLHLEHRLPETDQDRAVIDQFFSANVPALELVDRADVLPMVDATSGERAVSLFDLERLSSILSIRARTLARSGHVEQAGAALLQEFGLLRAFQHVESNPENGARFGAATRPWAARRAARDLEVVLNSGTLTAATIERLQSAFALDLSSDLDRAIAWDARLLLDLSDSVADDRRHAARLDSPLPPWTASVMRPLFRRGLAEAAAVLSAVSDASHEMAPGMLKRLSAIESEHARTSFVTRPWNTTPLIAAISISSARNVASARALSAAATVALAVERFRIDRGALPEALPNLVPTYLSAIPVDPCDGAPMRFRRVGDRYTVYSVGLNGKDDGGNLTQGFDEGLTVGSD